MNTETTNNIIKLLGVGTLCLAFLALFALAYFKVIDAAPLVIVVIALITNLGQYIFTKPAMDAARIQAAQARAELATLRAENK